MNLLELENLHVTYSAGRGQRPVRAVRGVSLAVAAGESVGLVGESGCGKSSLAKAVVGLEPVAGGSIRLRGVQLSGLDRRGWRRFRGPVQMVFQDPFGSLNPRLSVQACLEEVLRRHRRRTAADAVPERDMSVTGLLEAVGLSSAFAARFPHELSGGQRQRIGIARALAAGPELLIADEPVSALDVSVQVQVLNLLRELQQRFGLSLLTIAHDLAVVQYVCERALVMYLGRVVEAAPTDTLFEQPAHPYTEALVSAVPDVERSLRRRGGAGERLVLRGDVPSATETIAGCPFHPRCHRAQPRCLETVPDLRRIAPGHFSACLFAGESGAAGGARVKRGF